MTGSVTDCRLSTDSPPPDGVRVYGDPFHETRESLVRDYLDLPTADFLAAEARRSCGSYVLVSTKSGEMEVVTSPGYCGGYVRETPTEVVVATTLLDALAGVPVTDLELDEAFVRHFLDHEPMKNRLPLSGLFHEVTRLPPGAHLTVVDGEIDALHSYLTSARSRPRSFADAIEEAAASLDGSNVGVMYSGGVDSTALYCALNETLPSASFELTTVDLDADLNGVRRARATANALGADVRVVDHDRPIQSTDLIEYVEADLPRDFVNPLEPEYAYATVDHDYDVIVNAETMDMLSTGVGDARPQTTQFQFLRSTRDVRTLLEKTARNVQYTSPYLERESLRRLYTTVVPHLIPTDVTVDATFAGCLKGLLSTVHPNFIAAGSEGDVARELDRFLRYGGDASPKATFDTLQYVYEAHNVLKRSSTFPKGNCRVFPVPTWGPITSYYLGADRPLSAVLSPKREVYEYVERRVGRSYFEFAFTDPEEIYGMIRRERERKESMRSRLLERNRHYFEGDSNVLALVSDPTLAERIRTDRERIASRLDGGLEFMELHVAVQILNLEAILSNLPEAPVEAAPNA